MEIGRCDHSKKNIVPCPVKMDNTPHAAWSLLAFEQNKCLGKESQIWAAEDPEASSTTFTLNHEESVVSLGQLLKLGQGF